MSTAIERFVRFHKHLQLTEMYPGRNALEDKLEVSKGYITKAMTKKSAMGSDLLERIMRLFPQLNIVWLLTGEGDMILEEDDSKYQVKDYRDTIINKMKDNNEFIRKRSKISADDKKAMKAAGIKKKDKAAVAAYFEAKAKAEAEAKAAAEEKARLEKEANPTVEELLKKILTAIETK